jgi:hypothetical protein
MSHASSPAVEGLRAVPPSRFIRERDARAAALAKAGKADEARAVKALRRPSPSLWAVNQLARVDPKGLGAFLQTAGQLRATQLRDPQAASETARRHREQLGALLERARDVLRGEGYRPTPALERRISGTLLGGAADRAVADDLRAGRLAAELQAPGFDALLGAPGAGRLRVVKGGATSPRTVAPAKAASALPAPPAPPADVEAEARRQRQARALAEEAATRHAAAERLEREIAAAATALAEQRRRLHAARQDAKRATAAARKAGRTTGRRAD